MLLLLVVEVLLVNLVENSNSGVDLGHVVKKVTPYRVGSIAKGSIFDLNTTTNR